MSQTDDDVLTGSTIFAGARLFGLREPDVNVVARGIDFDQRRVVVLEDAGEVGVELAAFLGTQELTAALRTEHGMNDDFGDASPTDQSSAIGQSGVEGCAQWLTVSVATIILRLVNGAAEGALHG